MTERHDVGNCETCAAQYEAEVVGAIPTMGHQSQRETLKECARDVALGVQAITHASDNATLELMWRLIRFAEEIKRQAVEP